MVATATGCSMKSSPDSRFWPAWAASAKTYAALDVLEVHLGTAGLDGAEQGVQGFGRLALGRPEGEGGRGSRLDARSERPPGG